MEIKFTPQELDHFVRFTILSEDSKGKIVQKRDSQPVSGLSKKEAIEYAEELKLSFLKKWEKTNIFKEKL